jgi:hypothetical protein
VQKQITLILIAISFLFISLLGNAWSNEPFDSLDAGSYTSGQNLNSLSVKDLNLKFQDIYVPSVETKAHTLKINLSPYDPLIPPSAFDRDIRRKIEIPGIDSTLEYAVKFRQYAYQPNDLQSDVSLLTYTKAIPKKLFQVLFGIIDNPTNSNAPIYNEENPVIEDIIEENPLPTEDDIMALDIPEAEKERLIIQIRNSKIMIEGRVNPLRVKQILKMYTQIMYEENLNGIKPKYGAPHSWSPEFIRYCNDKGETIPLVFSKLLMSLASGVTSRHMYTGKEDALRNYILSQEDESVTLDQIFRQSYILNDGDVYLSILTPLNILSDAWRHPDRNKLAVTRKLSVITNFYNGKGDKFGSWYHLHGIMLYGYVKGGFKATVVGHIESIGSHILGEGDEQQEDHVNGKGGRIGAKIAKIVKKEKYLEFDAQGVNYCDPEVYLNLTEDYRDRIEIINSTDFKTTLSFERLWIKSLNKDYLNCKVEVMYNDYSGKLNSENLIVRENVSILKGKKYIIYINSFEKVERARAFITGCSNQPDQAIEDYDPFADEKEDY